MIRVLSKILILVVFFSPIIFSQNNSSTAVFDLNNQKLLGISDWEYLKPNSEDTRSDIIDSSWNMINLNEFNSLATNLITIRKKILLKGDVDDSDALALLFYNIPSAFEVYWDKQLIGTNGRVGKSTEQEEVGIVRFYVPLKISYTSSGEHIISLKISNFSSIKKKYLSQIVFGYSSAISLEEEINTNKNILFLTFFFSMVLVSLSLYISGWRNLSFLFLGIFTFLLSVKYVWLYTLDLDFINVSFFQWINSIIVYLTEDLAIFFLFLFVIWHFNISNKKKHFFTGLFFLIMIIFLTANNYGLSFWILRLLVSIYATFIIMKKLDAKISGSYSLLLAFGIFLIYSGFNFYYYLAGESVSISFLVRLIVNVFIFSLFVIAISVKIQDQNRKFQSVLLRSQRLESELLKKSIQPHFIMNTLLSIKSQMLKDSAKAEKLIDALANQFRIINEISDKNEIPLEEEIKLCKLHLELMGYRFNANYDFILKCDLNSKNIPPLIFHTLVENAFTHSYLPKEKGTFYFVSEINSDKTVYKLINNGSQIINLKDKSTDEIDEGLGLKYIRTRLEESYPGNWKLDYGIVNNLWEVQITIRNRDTI